MPYGFGHIGNGEWGPPGVWRAMLNGLLLAASTEDQNAWYPEFPDTTSVNFTGGVAQLAPDADVEGPTWSGHFIGEAGLTRLVQIDAVYLSFSGGVIGGLYAPDPPEWWANTGLVKSKAEYFPGWDAPIIPPDPWFTLARIDPTAWDTVTADDEFWAALPCQIGIGTWGTADGEGSPYIPSPTTIPSVLAASWFTLGVPFVLAAYMGVDAKYGAPGMLTPIACSMEYQQDGRPLNLPLIWDNLRAEVGPSLAALEQGAPMVGTAGHVSTPTYFRRGPAGTDRPGQL